MLPHAEQAEAAAHAVNALAAGADVAPEGRVRVAVADAFAAFVLAPRVGEFLDDHPGIQLELLASPNIVDLTRLEAEIALRFVQPTHGDLVAQRLGSTGAYGGWVHQTYIERHGVPVGLPTRWIGWGSRFAHLPEAQLYQRTVGIPPRLACDDLTTMMMAWQAGAGALLLPGNMAAFAQGAVRTEAPASMDLELSMWLVTHSLAATGAPSPRGARLAGKPCGGAQCTGDQVIQASRLPISSSSPNSRRRCRSSLPLCQMPFVDAVSTT